MVQLALLFDVHTLCDSSSLSPLARIAVMFAYLPLATEDILC